MQNTQPDKKMKKGQKKTGKHVESTPPASTLKKYFKIVYDLVETLFIAFLLAMLIRTYIVQPFYIPSSSMEDTLLINDHILANKFLYYFREIKQGDIIIFRWPKSSQFPTTYDNRGQYIRVAWRVFFNLDWKWNNISEWFTWYAPRDYIKRVIGLPGDVVMIRSGIVYVNDKPLKEDYIKEKPNKDMPPVKVIDDHLFVMGDNRNNSSDSRYWGFVPVENVMGRAVLRYWPIPRIGILR